MQILVPCLLQRRKPVIDNVGRSVEVLLPSILEFIDELVRDSVHPGLILVTVFAVAVAIVHDLIVN